MTKDRTTPWVLGALILSLAIGALAWFFAISPVVDSAAEAREQVDEQSARNDMLVVQNAQLRKQFEEIDIYRDELAGYQTGIPDSVQQREYALELAALSEASGAFLVDIAFESSTLVLADASGISGLDLASLQAEAEAADDDEADADAGQTTAVPSTTLVPTPPQGLFAVPVRLTVLGSPEATTEFLTGLQQQTNRLFLVASIDIVGQEEAGASGGRPATKEGDAELAISGYLYVLNEDAVDEPEQPATDGAVDDTSTTESSEPLT